MPARRGRAAALPSRSRTARKLPSQTVPQVLRLGLVGLFGGAVAGAIVGGIGSRLVMRLLAAINSEAVGVTTENGNIAGQITLEGSVDLFVLSLAFVGPFGGLLYVLARRWIPGKGLWKGLAFGVLLFLIFSGAIIGKDNRDFALFGPPLLGVALFALLFPLYGLLASPIIERFDRYVPPAFTRPAATAVGYVALTGVAAFGLFHGVVAINIIL